MIDGFNSILSMYTENTAVSVPEKSDSGIDAEIIDDLENFNG